MFDFDAHEAAEAARTAAAMVDGKHYSAHASTVKAMRKAGNDDEAAGLLLRLIEAIEREATIPLAGGCGVPPWYFNQLAIIYRKSGKKVEAGLLMQRYALLDAEATKSGELLLREMRQLPVAASAAGADELPRLRLRKMEARPAPKPRAARSKPRRSGAKTGRFIGALVGAIFGKR